MPIRTHRFINFERTPYALASSIIKNINHVCSHIDELLTAGHITTDEYLILTEPWARILIQNDFLTAIAIRRVDDLRRALIQLCGWEATGDGILRIADFSMPAETALHGAAFQIRPIISTSRLAHRLVDFAIRIPLYWQEFPPRSENAFQQTRERAILDQLEAIRPRCPQRCPYFRPPISNLEEHVRRTMHGYHNITRGTLTGEAPGRLYHIPNLFNLMPIEDLLGNAAHAIINSARTYLETQMAGGPPAPPAKLPFEPTTPAEADTLDGLLADIDQLTKTDLKQFTDAGGKSTNWR